MSSGGLPGHVLGMLCRATRLIESCELSRSDFPDGRYRDSFGYISEIWENEHPEVIPLAVLASKLGGNDAGAFVGALVDGIQTPTPGVFRAAVREMKRKVLTARILAKVEDQAKSGELSLEEIRPDLAAYENLTGTINDINACLKSGSEIQALEVETAWSVEKLVPARSITLLHSPGGLGKTWFSLSLANAVSQGLPFLGLATTQRPVYYIDFENPLPLLIDRARKLDIRETRFWHLSADTPPPKLDTAAHALYRQLRTGSLIVFDTLRAAHDGDENSSQDMALVMGRLKELRELDHDIFLIHHTGKANERQYKGSTAISDLADHVLKLYRARPGTLEELPDDDEPDPDATFVLTTGKTRFEPFHMYLKFNPSAGGFTAAEDPNLDVLEALAGHIAGPGRDQNQTDLIEWARDNLGGGRRENLISLLKRGEREGRWRSHKVGRKRIYEPSN